MVVFNLILIIVETLAFLIDRIRGLFVTLIVTEKRQRSFLVNQNNHNVIGNPIVFHFRAWSKQENNFLLKKSKKYEIKPDKENMMFVVVGDVQEKCFEALRQQRMPGRDDDDDKQINERKKI